METSDSLFRFVEFSDRHALMPQSISELESFATWGLNDLQQWAAGRAISYGFERSVRLQQNTFEIRRGLFSFSVKEIGGSAAAEVVAICRAMRVPERLVPSLSRFFPAAAFVHFGFEHAGPAMIGKCYLELPAPAPDTALVSGRLQFLGFKWSTNDASVAVVTRYRSLSISSWNTATELMLANTGTSLRPAMLKLMSRHRTVESCNYDGLSLLEIEEEGSDRRSYDLNVYNLGLSVSTFAEALHDAAKTLNLKLETVNHWLDANATAPVGHIATGLGRDQQSFVTVYCDPRRAETIMNGTSS